VFKFRSIFKDIFQEKDLIIKIKNIIHIKYLKFLINIMLNFTVCC